MIFGGGSFCNPAEPRRPANLKMTPETDFVVALSRTPLGNKARERAQRLLERGVGWSRVLPLATQWRVEPTVFGNLGSEFAAAMPTDVRAEVATLEMQSRAYAVSRSLILLDLVRELEASGIPVLVLKGPAIAITAYDDPSRRIFSDADLLVRRQDLNRARDLVLARGYTASFQLERESALIASQEALEFSDSRMAVELHWTLLSRHLRFNLDVDDLWREAVEIECLGSTIRTLGPEHQFLYLCAHGAKHEWGVFRWICDVAQLSQRLTPQQAASVVELAAKANARRLLSLGLRIVRRLYGEEQSPFPLAAFRSEAETSRLVGLVEARLTSESRAALTLLPRRVANVHRYMEPLAFWIQSRERPLDRMAIAAQFLFLPAAGDTSRNQIQRVFRPIRLAANALRRFAHAS
jgi:hypothetical protein